MQGFLVQRLATQSVSSLASAAEPVQEAPVPISGPVPVVETDERPVLAMAEPGASEQHECDRAFAHDAESAVLECTAASVTSRRRPARRLAEPRPSMLEIDNGTQHASAAIERSVASMPKLSMHISRPPLGEISNRVPE